MNIRVLHVQDHTVPEMSGYAFRSRYVVATQRALGIDAEVVSSARHRTFSAPVETIDGLRFHRTPWPAGRLARAQLRIPFWRERVLVAALRDRILEVAGSFRPAVIHAHSPIFNGLAALRAGERLGIPVVYEIRAFWEDDAVDKGKFAEGSFVYRQVRRIETGICRRARHVVPICEGLRLDLEERGIPASRLTVVRNGVDPLRFVPAPPDRALAERLGLSGKIVVGFIGSFFHYEGLPLLVEAAARLRATHPALRVLLVGGGEDEERTRARARELQAEDLVIFAGRVPHAEIDAWYSLPEVLVYPRLSKRITELVTPLKPLEALAMEKAVIGSDVGGVRDLLQDCGAGRLFRAGSADDLARVLKEWLEAPLDVRAREREAGRRSVLEHRSWEQVVSPILPVYEGLAGIRQRNPMVPQGK